jgi:uncharacterized protein (DUF2225 family)
MNNFSIDYLEVDIECPKCKYEFQVLLREVKLESIVICHNCKIEIQLKDENASAYSVQSQVSNLVDEMNKMFKKFK